MKLNIQESGNYLIIEDLKYSYSNDKEDDSYDRNWLNGLISLKAGKFAGKYSAYFQTIDFYNLKEQLEILYNDLNGTVKFSTLEDQLKMEFIGDGLGHFQVDCKAVEEAGVGSELNFIINIDQTDLKSIINELIQLTQNLPVR